MKGYRTIIANLVPLVALLTDYLVGNSEFVKLVAHNPERAVLVIGFLNMGNIILRFVTTTPVGKKEQ